MDVPNDPFVNIGYLQTDDVVASLAADFGSSKERQPSHGTRNHLHIFSIALVHSQIKLRGSIECIEEGATI